MTIDAIARINIAFDDPVLGKDSRACTGASAIFAVPFDSAGADGAASVGPTVVFTDHDAADKPPRLSACTLTVTCCPFVNPLIVQVTAGAIAVQLCPPAFAM